MVFGNGRRENSPIRPNGSFQPSILRFFAPVRSANGNWEGDAETDMETSNLIRANGVCGEGTATPSASKQKALNPCATCPHLVLRRISTSTKNDPPDEYEVEEVLRIEKRQDKFHFFIKWKGWSPKFNSWEPEESVAHCMALVISCCVQSNSSYRFRLMRSAIKGVCNRARPDVMVMSKLVGFEVPGNGYVSKTQLADIRKTIWEMLDLTDKCLSRKLEELFGSWKNFLELVEARKEQAKVITDWEEYINKASEERCPLFVENYVDLETPPTPNDFVYLKDFLPGQGIVFPEEPEVGCQCTDCYSGKEQCCPQLANTTFMYNRHGTLVVNRGGAIWECNSRCKCSNDCPNRVVQKGRQVPLTIFRTTNKRGWGVRTERRIKKGTFLFEYFGEVITNEEAEQRGRTYDAQGITYLFDLDYDDSDDNFYTVDAGKCGNVSHFVNHSCDSNMNVYSVWINNLNRQMPRLAFFASKDICCQEELTFDYKMSLSNESEDVSGAGAKGRRSSRSGLTGQKSTNRARIPCLCGASACRKFLV